MCEFARLADPTKAKGEQLFLLEVLVDKLDVQKEGLLEDKPSARPVRVKCKFFDFPVIEIDQGDFQLTETGKPVGLPKKQDPCEIPCLDDLMNETPKKSVEIGMLPCVDPPIDYNTEMNTAQSCCREKAKSMAANLPPGTKFTGGKSCLFPMRPDALKKAVKDCPIYVCVYRAGLANEPHQMLGQTKVTLGDPFVESIDLSKWSQTLPVSAYIEEILPLSNVFGEVTGEIKIFVRLTCFGNSMFTEFQYDGKPATQTAKPPMQSTNPAFKSGPRGGGTSAKEDFGCSNPQCCRLAGAQQQQEEERYLPMVSAPENMALSTLRSKQVDEKFKRPVPWRRCMDPVPYVKICGPPKLAPSYNTQENPVQKNSLEEKKRSVVEQRQDNKPKGEGSAPQPQTPAPQPPNTSQTPMMTPTVPQQGPGGQGGVCTCPKLPPVLLPGPEPPQYSGPCTCPTMNAAKNPVPQQNPDKRNVTRPQDEHLQKTSNEGNPPQKESGLTANPQTNKNTNANQNSKNVAPAPPTNKNNPQPVKSAGDSKEANPNQGQPPAPPNKPPPQNLTSGGDAPPPPAGGPTNDDDKKAKNPKPPAEMPDSVKQVLETELETHEQTQKTRRMRYKSLYEYTAGMYPGIHVGHKYCITPVRLVPKSMGWMWNASGACTNVRPGRGWRPGAINKEVAGNIRSWKRESGLVTPTEASAPTIKKRPISTPRRGYPKLRGGNNGTPLTPKSQASQVQETKPTLHIHKKEGFYYVSMYPTKRDSDDDEAEVKPLKFKIDAKRPDGESGSSDDGNRTGGSSSSSESLEIEYMSPAALMPRKKKVFKTNAETQYLSADFEPPKPPEPVVAKADAGGKKGGKGGKGGKKGKKK